MDTGPLINCTRNHNTDTDHLCMQAIYHEVVVILEEWGLSQRKVLGDLDECEDGTCCAKERMWIAVQELDIEELQNPDFYAYTGGHSVRVGNMTGTAIDLWRSDVVYQPLKEKTMVISHLQYEVEEG